MGAGIRGENSTIEVLDFYIQNDYLKKIQGCLDKNKNLCYFLLTSKLGTEIEIGKKTGKLLDVSVGIHDRPICLFGEIKIIIEKSKIV